MTATAFETTSFLYVNPIDSTSMQELLMQEHKQKIYKTCSCEGDTWHIESKQILQPPKYLIIIVNRITYSNKTWLLRTKVACLWIYILNWVLTNFSYKLLWTILDILWTVVITQPHSIVVGKHFTVAVIKLLNVMSRIPIIHLLPTYFCTNSWNIRAAICLEGRLSLLALSSVYSLTVEDGSWSTPMVPAQLSVPLQQVEE